MAASQTPMINSHTANDIERCAFEGIPFVIYKKPGQVPIFRKAHTCDQAQKNGFFIGKFAMPFSQNLWLSLDESDSKASSKSNHSPLQPNLEKDTDKETYLADIQTLIASLKDRGDAKTVISTIQTRCLPTMRLSEMVENLMSQSSDCFAFCFYHPNAGLWAGATPELLFKVDANGKYSTMALAGTLPMGESWDDKNAEEHEYVCRYISERLNSLGLSPRRHSTKSIGYGPIQHLRTDFTGEIGTADPFEVIDALNPTPALCGWPVDAALADIAAIERHKRECYGGCIGLVEDGTVEAYVNIRCARIQGSFVTAYAGGGIISQSTPIIEWNEARIKRLAIFNKLINGR